VTSFVLKTILQVYFKVDWRGWDKKIDHSKLVNYKRNSINSPLKQKYFNGLFLTSKMATKRIYNLRKIYVSAAFYQINSNIDHGTEFFCRINVDT
jgi:hypothetical protein